MLGGALSGATRLAVFSGAMILASATLMPLRAQVAPPVTPPATPPVAQPAASPAASPTIPSTIPTATPNVNPATPAVTTAPQTVALPAGAQQQIQTAAPTAPAVPKPVVPTAQKAAPGATAANAKVGTPNSAASTRPTSKMVLDSAANAARNPRATPAQPAGVGAEEALMKLMPQMDVKLGDEKEGGLRLNGTVGIVVMMGLLTLLPTLLLMMTGFTRILIVLHFLKQAMGTQSAPPAQLLAGMALLLTGFVMAPTLKEVNNRAITPWLDGKMTQVEMMKTGVMPMREFMLKQTRESDLKTFIDMSRLPRPNSVDDVPLHVLMSAFVASELRTAFQIGFAIYLPFIIIDAVVASVLMSMGMFMLPPAMISLPFKLLLFVLVDGWSLTISSLVQSFK
jgi:flagellar biosynthetic protein FliP